jgi:deoxyribonuclease V
MNINQAKKIQNFLKQKVKIYPLRKKIYFIAGVDAAFGEDTVIGTACLFSFPELEFLEESWAVKKIPVPYIPGFLSFRESPAILAALKKLATRPDLILVDGQGIAHPRWMGIASHLGVLLDTPTIGCAKSRLIGEYREPGLKKGNWAPLKIDQETVGAVLRTRDRVRPLFVSPGHRIDLKESIKIVLKATTVFRISEPLRRADHFSKILKKRS